MNNDDLIKKGFVKLPHFTIGNTVIFDLGRHRQLSASAVGTPNEMVYICEVNHQNEKEITDLICLHNYDYDGYLTEEKIDKLLDVLKWKNIK